MHTKCCQMEKNAGVWSDEESYFDIKCNDTPSEIWKTASKSIALQHFEAARKEHSAPTNEAWQCYLA